MKAEDALHDDEYADMIMDYARSPEGQAKIAQAQAEIDADLGLEVDDASFEHHKARCVQRIAGKSTKQA